jgi:hypothetical protein
MAPIFKAKRMSKMMTDKDVLIFGDISVTPVTMQQTNPMGTPVDHPNDELWAILDAPNTHIKGKIDGAGNDHVLKNIAPLLIFEQNASVTAGSNKRHLHALANTNFVTIYAPKYVAHSSLTLLNALSIDINQRDFSDPNKVEDYIVEYQSTLFNTQVPDYWTHLLIDPLVSEGMRNRESLKSIAPKLAAKPPSRGIYIAQSQIDPNTKMNVGVAHFTLIPPNATQAEEKQVMENTIYAAVTNPAHLAMYLVATNTTQYLDGNELKNIDPGNKRFNFTIPTDSSLKVIYETSSTKTIVTDGCIKMTGYWDSSDPNVNPVFIVTSIVMTPW